MSHATEREFARHKLAERRNIDAHVEDGAKWVKARLAEVRAGKSRATGDDWLRLHAAECALMEEICERQNRGKWNVFELCVRLCAVAYQDAEWVTKPSSQAGRIVGVLIAVGIILWCVWLLGGVR